MAPKVPPEEEVEQMKLAVLAQSVATAAAEPAHIPGDSAVGERLTYVETFEI